MKKHINAVIGMVALAIVMFQSFVNAEDIRLTIKHEPWSQLVTISWPYKPDVGYRAYSSLNLQSWHAVSATVQIDRFTDYSSDGVRFYRVEKMPPPLTVSRYSGFGDQRVVGGRNNLKLGSFVLAADSFAGVMISSATVYLDSEEHNSVNILRLVDQATGEILSQKIFNPTNVNTFFLGGKYLPPLGSKVIDLYGDIRPGTVHSNWQAVISVNGVSEAAGVAAFVTTAVPIQTITIIDHGILTVTNGAMPKSAIVLPDSTNNYMAQFKFSATNEGFTIEKLTLNVNREFALAKDFTHPMAEATIRYKDRSGAFQQATCMFDRYPLANVAFASFTGLTMYVPADGNADLDVYVSFGSGSIPGAASAVVLSLHGGFYAYSDTYYGYSPVLPADPSGNTFYIRKSKPTFTKLEAGTDPVNGSLYRFSVVADSAGQIEIKQLGFQVTAVGCSVTRLYLYDPDTATSLGNGWGVDPFTGSGIANLTVGSLDDSQVLLVGANYPKIYEVRGTVTGYNAPGDSITVRSLPDTSPIDDSWAYSIGAGERGHNIWSDRSNSDHTVYTDDWTNGYLLEGMDQIQVFQK